MNYIYKAITIIFLLYILFNVIAFGLVAVNSNRMRKKYLKKKRNGVVGNEIVNNDHIQNSPEKVSVVKKLYRKLYLTISGLTKYVSIKISMIPSHNLRHFLINRVLASGLNSNTVVYYGSIFRGAFKIDIGRGTIVGDECLLDGRGELSIGENCNLSTGVKIWTGQHDLNSPTFAYESAPVKIGNHCWISGGVTILPGVTVNDGCVVASGAVVTKDCEAYGIYAGIPAKKIGVRNNNLQYEFDGRHDWFL